MSKYSITALAAAAALGIAVQPIAAPRRNEWHDATKHAKRRPRVNPAGTKLARMAREGRLGLWR